MSSSSSTARGRRVKRGNSASSSNPKVKRAKSSQSTTAQKSDSRSGKPQSLASFDDVLAPETAESFFDTTFEQSYKHICAPNDNKAAAASSLFSLDNLATLLSAGVPLSFVKDINMFEYKDGVKQDRNPYPDEGEDESDDGGDEQQPRPPCCSKSARNDGGCCDGADALDSPGPFVAVTKEHVVDALSNGHSIQYHQPQRFSRDLQRLLADFERVFGCLAGANIYITPPKSQGLAPHNDDIEAFVIQLSGQKQWHLYEPHQRLARSYSADLQRDDIGDPIKTLVLNPGDVLYFPRGMIHEAKTVGDEPSIHVTISTYQRWAMADFLTACLPAAIQDAAESCELLRQGLPRRLGHVLGKINAATEGTAAEQQQAFIQKIRKVFQEDAVWTELGPALCERTDEFLHDFVTHRLPSSCMESDGNAAGNKDDLPRGAKFSIVDPTALCIIPHDANNEEMDEDEEIDDDEDEGQDEDEDDEQGRSSGEQTQRRFVLLFNSLRNNPTAHMMGDSDVAPGGELEDDLHDQAAQAPQEQQESDEQDDEQQEQEEQFSQIAAPGSLPIRLPISVLPGLQALGNVYPNGLTLKELESKCDDALLLVATLLDQGIVKASAP